MGSSTTDSIYPPSYESSSPVIAIVCSKKCRVVCHTERFNGVTAEGDMKFRILDGNTPLESVVNKGNGKVILVRGSDFSEGIQLESGCVSLNDIIDKPWLKAKGSYLRIVFDCRIVLNLECAKVMILENGNFYDQMIKRLDSGAASRFLDFENVKRFYASFKYVGRIKLINSL